MKGKDCFLRFSHRGFVTNSLTLPGGTEGKLELGLRGDVRSVRFYLGNDDDVILRQDAPFAREEGDYRVYEVILRAAEFAPAGRGLFFFHFEPEYPDGRRYTAFDGDLLSLAREFSGELQLTVYQPSKLWIAENRVYYEIFVDRFRRSGRIKHPRNDDWHRFNPDWENGVPEYPPEPGQPFPNNTHFGGDIDGIIEKLPYLSSLGVNGLYLTPVNIAYSNHKYDVGDYLTVDNCFGGDEALARLTYEAHERGMTVLLDLVLNHVGADSRYFNRYIEKKHFIQIGAFVSRGSVYNEWFNIAERRPTPKYECWWGMENLPRIVPCESFREFICEEVIPFYMEDLGVDGFRLDVADELTDQLLDDVNGAVRACNQNGLVIGEVWEDASNKVSYDRRRRYFQGGQLDGVMNYPFRNALLDFLQTGDATLLRRTTTTLVRHYPPEAMRHTLNNIGTHDTPRILTLLGDGDGEGLTNDEKAVRRLTPEQREKAKRLLICGYPLFCFLPGIPCLYYGDEAGMEGYGDPFNRRPFPWNRPDEDLFAVMRAYNLLRQKLELLWGGDFEVLDSPSSTFAFRRFRRPFEGSIEVVCNRTEQPLVWKFQSDLTMCELLTLKWYTGNVTVPPYTTLCFHSTRYPDKYDMWKDPIHPWI